MRAALGVVTALTLCVPCNTLIVRGRTRIRIPAEQPFEKIIVALSMAPVLDTSRSFGMEQGMSGRG